MSMEAADLGFRRCQHCGHPFIRRRRDDSKIEDANRFGRRQFCGKTCQREANGVRMRSDDRGAGGWDPLATNLPPAFTVHRGDYWRPGDPVWGPKGLRGAALTHRIAELIDDQVAHALADPGVRVALRGGDRDELERAIKRALRGARLGKLFEGTLRRVAQSPRIVGAL